MNSLDILDAAYKVCVTAGTLGSAALVVWKRRTIFDTAKNFFQGIREIVAMRPDIGVIVAMRRDLEFVVSELKPNSGKTLRDRVTKLENESTRQIEILVDQNGVLGEMKEQSQRDLEELRKGFKDLSARFSRFVKHEADNDLHTSRLADEERERTAGEEDTGEAP